jgi:hypothetical protein
LRKRHLLVLAVATFVVMMAFALDVLPGGTRVAFHGLHGWPLPQTCLFRVWTGRDCAGCGLTRSFILLAHGRFQESIHMHRLGWLMALAVVLQIPYRLLSLRRRDRPLLPRPIPQVFGWCLIVALVVNWVAGMVI